MILTGHAKEDFISFMCKTYPNIRWHDYENMNDSMINALIIEWFDSVGIYIAVEPKKEFKNVYYDVSINFELHSVWSSRLQATNEAITKANEIYNTSN